MRRHRFEVWAIKTNFGFAKAEDDSSGFPYTTFKHKRDVMRYISMLDDLSDRPMYPSMKPVKIIVTMEELE